MSTLNKNVRQDAHVTKIKGVKLWDISKIFAVELTTNVAAPMGTGLLADQGADVIRIESVSAGDPARAVGATRGGVTSYYLSLNRNKRSISVDLKDPKTRPMMEGLVRSADVFIQYARSG